MQLIKDTISKVKVGAPKTFKNLTVFPIMGDNGGTAEYLTLDEALAAKAGKVTEVSDSGSVPELKFANSGQKQVFLLDGEELIGAKQNRILNLSILAPAGKTIIIPVSCVESGRWHHRSREFSTAPRAHYAEGRAKKMAQVSHSMKSSGRKMSDQGAVWSDISEKFSKFRSSSATSAMSDIYEQQSVRLEDYVRSFSTSGEQVGALFAINGKIVGFDLFDSAGTLRKLFPKLLRSYGLDALDRVISAPFTAEATQPPSQADAEGFLNTAAEAEGEEFHGVGEGRDVRLTSAGLTGAALASDGRIVHLSAFVLADGPRFRSQRP